MPSDDEGYHAHSEASTEDEDEDEEMLTEKQTARKRKLERLVGAENVWPDRVFCQACQTDILLDRNNKFVVNNWMNHIKRDIHLKAVEKRSLERRAQHRSEAESVGATDRPVRQRSGDRATPSAATRGAPGAQTAAKRVRFSARDSVPEQDSDSVIVAQARRPRDAARPNSNAGSARPEIADEGPSDPEVIEVQRPTRSRNAAAGPSRKRSAASNDGDDHTHASSARNGGRAMKRPKQEHPPEPSSDEEGRPGDCARLMNFQVPSGAAEVNFTIKMK